LLAGAALYALTLALFALAARYRLPIVVLLIPLAGVNLAAWLEALFVERTRLARQVIDARGIAVACVCVLCNVENRYTAGFAASATERSLLLSQAYAAQGQSEPALAHARTATALSPLDPDAQVQLGRLLLNAGHAQDAALHFYRAGISLPESEVPWTLHGQAMFSLQRYGDAIYNFREALVRNPFHEESLRALSLTYLRVGDLAHATQALRRYLEAGYRDDAALRKLTKLWVDQDQTAQATAFLHSIQARHPGWTTPNGLIQQLHGTQ
jgi:Tfp pilus assembly protein PilF